MDKRILLGVDASFTPATQQAIRVVSDLLDYSSTSFHIVLLLVIPIVQVITEHAGPFAEHYFQSTPTDEQMKSAEETLKKVSQALQEYGLRKEHIEQIVRIGIPAEEICKVAQEQQVSLIMVGSRGDGWRQNLRRFVMGSTSRRVLKMASCPVMIVIPTKSHQTRNLVSWYEDKIRHYLEQHPQELAVFTPEKTVRCFSTDENTEVNRKEIEAATIALEHLTDKGCLIRREFQGNIHYIND